MRAYEEESLNEIDASNDSTESYEIPKGILTWGRFEKYNCPLLSDVDVWRIGCIGEGSCFFHAILTASDKNYRALNSKNREAGETERCQYVKEIRKRLSLNMSEDVWETLQGGNPRVLSVSLKLEQLSNVIDSTFQNPHNHKKNRRWIYDAFNSDLELITILSKVCGKNHIDLTVVNNFQKNKSSYQSSSECEKIFVKHHMDLFLKKIEKVLKTIAKSKSTAYVSKAASSYKEFLRITFKHATKEAYSHLRENIGDVESWVGTELWDYFIDQFGLNIIVINGDTGYPYVTTVNVDPDKRTVLLLSINNIHYECLGYQVKTKEGERAQIQCKWPSEHSTFEKINTLLHNRKKAKKKYPELYSQMYGEQETIPLNDPNEE